MIMYTKEELVKRLDPNYLEEVTLALYNSPRYDFLSKSERERVEYYASRYREQLVDISQSFVIGKKPSEVASKLKESSGKELARLFIRSLPKGRCDPKMEFRVGDRLCDLVYLDSEGDINAVEVKANGDKLSPAVGQTADYSLWANKVWLLIDEKKISELERVELPEYVGVLVYRTNTFEVMKAPKRIHHDITEYLPLLTVTALKNLAELFGIKKAGTKEEMKDRILAGMKQPHLGVVYSTDDSIRRVFVQC